MDASHDDARDLGEDLSDIFGAAVRVDRVDQKEFGNAKLAVLDMRYTRVRHSDRGGGTTTTQVAQSAVVLDDQHLDNVRVLVDPNDPDHVVCVDLILIF